MGKLHPAPIVSRRYNRPLKYSQGSPTDIFITAVCTAFSCQVSLNQHSTFTLATVHFIGDTMWHCTVLLGPTSGSRFATASTISAYQDSLAAHVLAESLPLPVKLHKA